MKKMAGFLNSTLEHLKASSHKHTYPIFLKIAPLKVQPYAAKKENAHHFNLIIFVQDRVEIKIE
jgi:hypothetical protein